MDMKKHFELGMLKLLKEKCIDKIAINELIQVVGSCKGTLYKYYVDKYDLCYKSLLNSVYAQLPFDVNNWEQFLIKYIDVMDKNSKVVFNAFNSNDINSTRHYNERLISGVLSSLLGKQGVDVSDSLTAFSIECCGVFITDGFYHWMKKGKTESKAEFALRVRAIIPQTIYSYIYS